jgi:hypothetical protein
VRVRTIAAGVTLAALAGTAVPLVLSGAASAKGSGTPTTMAITKCSPTVATFGKSVTIHGTDLGGVTKVMLGSHNVTADVTGNTPKAIKINPVPGGMAVTPNAVTVKVVAAGGSATNNTSCHFQKPKKKKSHKG